MDRTGRTAQPGLEVTSHYDNPPIPIDSYSNNWTSTSNAGSAPGHHLSQEPKILAGNGYELAGRHGYANGNGTAQAPANDNSSRRKSWLPVGLGGLVIFVLAGVIGGVAGWKITSDRNHDQESAAALPGSAGTTPSTSATKIMDNSGLAAVGWRYGTDITLQVWVQGPDTALRRLQYMSIYQNWTAPLAVDAAPKAGSPLGAGQLWTKPDPLPVLPQAELFYLGSQDEILGVNWREGFTSGGKSDSVGGRGWMISNSGSQMAAYWPSIVLQASDGDVMEVAFSYRSPGFQEPRRVVGVTASPGSALAIFPRESTHSAGDLTAASSARIIYRDTSGRLRNHDRSSGGQQLTSSGELPVTVDSNFTMAGFAVARGDVGGQASSAVNTWVLYQDSKGGGKISYVYENDGEGWKGPETDPVFDGADNPTHLACVTASSAKIPEVPLEPAHDLSHCFFQAGKRLKHVHFDGDLWTDMGFVAIP